mmetsp:Transcript_99339/g.157133  ORF Transcript_99339/g.157133 Transcript_99339/m.157133 type:complete len:458 (-) Transcript_99339:133-1506(-)
MSWCSIAVWLSCLIHQSYGEDRLSSTFNNSADDKRQDFANLLLALGPQVLPQRGTHASMDGASLQRRLTSETIASISKSAHIRPPPSSSSRRVSAPVMAKKDLYATLGVGSSATEREIKAAWKKRARKCHPDVNPSEEAKVEFAALQEALDILTDKNKRSVYDQYGYDAVMNSGDGGFGRGGGFGGGGFEEFDIGDIFDSFFSGGTGRSRQRRSDGPKQGDDLRFEITIDFQTAMFGGSKKILINHLETCGTCEGSGVAPGAKIETCRTCGGQGVQIQVMNTILGRVQQQVPCGDCQGTGKKVEKYCGKCDGKGLRNVAKQLTITIPCGIQTDNRLRIKGEGDAGQKGGPSGDLYVFVTVANDPKFKREDATIKSDERISYLDAILGCKKTIDTIDGTVTLKIPPGTQPDEVLKISGKGAPRLNRLDSRGDHLVTIKVDIPRSVSDKERKILEQLQE